MDVGEVLLGAGRVALAEGRWADAVDAGTRAITALPAPGADRACAAVVLSDALWWLGRLDEALAARATAYEVWRSLGDDEEAALTALWLAREYAAGAGNDAAAAGWLARASTLAGEPPSASVEGWRQLTLALLASDPWEQVVSARRALHAARAGRDGDLEVLALGRLSLATIATGEVEAGLRSLDEAMAAATGGEADLSTLAALCCELVAASELSGQMERFARWNEVVGSLAVRHGHPPLLAFCASCCAEAFVAGGDWEGAERELRGALEQLRRSGHVARCVPPTARLGELLMAQGRFEEAEQLVEGDETDGTLLVRARLALARGRPTSARVLLERQIRRHGGDSLLTAPALALLVTASLAGEDHQAAAAVADRLGAVAATTGHALTVGRAALARARVAAAEGDVRRPVQLLEEALDHLTAVAPGSVETAEAHLELARLQATDQPDAATDAARSALAGFETAGAAHLANVASALLRTLGDHRHVGPKHVGVLTRREQEVLALVAQGLTNAEIAERLYISTKTAGNHVSNLLAKLGLRSRVEAAAYAALRSHHRRPSASR